MSGIYLFCPRCRGTIFQTMGMKDNNLLIRCGHKKCSQILAIPVYDMKNSRKEFRCPICHTHPPKGAYWGCQDPKTLQGCGKTLDTFEHNGRCPHCSTTYLLTQCLFCRAVNEFDRWRL
jgi:hypothetical protein